MMSLGIMRRAVLSSPGWMVTMTDLGFLILTFFILQYSMSSPRPEPWAEAQAAMTSRLGPGLAPLPVEHADEAPATAPSSQSAVALDYLASVINARLGSTPLGTAKREGDTLVLRVDGDVELDAGARAGFGVLVAALRFVANGLRLEARAVAGAPGGAGASDAWLAAMTRASTVAGMFRDAGLVRPVTIMARVTPWSGAASESAEPQVGEIDIIISGNRGDTP